MTDPTTALEGCAYRVSAGFGSRVQISVRDGTASVTGRNPPLVVVRPLARVFDNVRTLLARCVRLHIAAT